MTSRNIKAICLRLRVLGRHAPSVTIRVRDCPSAPWMTEEIREARRRRRLAERRWRATRLTFHREIYAKERAAVKACVQEAKRRFYCEKIDSSSPAGSSSLCPANCWENPAPPLSHQTSPVPICPIGCVAFSPSRLTVSVTTWIRAHVSHRPLHF